MVDILAAGGSGKDGTLKILGADGKPLLQTLLSDRKAPPGAKSAEVQIGTNTRAGVVTMFGLEAQRTVMLDGASGTLNLGSPGKNTVGLSGRQLIMSGEDTNPQFSVTLDNSGTHQEVGFPGRPGRFRAHGKEVSKTGAPVEVTAEDARLQLGRSGTNGRITLHNAAAQERVDLNADTGVLRIGGNGVNGTVSVLGSDGMPLLELLGRPNEATLGLGQKGRPARISLYSGTQKEAIKLDAATGDILLANADCAEEFDVESGAEPGMVMVLTADGALAVSEKPYDTRVAGVVSGAGSYRPGLVLDRRDTGRERLPIALMGKVYCHADATTEPIEVGDLLTTSETAGHAMKLIDRDQALGAVLGKALAPLRTGTGLIPILVALQ